MVTVSFGRGGVPIRVFDMRPNPAAASLGNGVTLPNFRAVRAMNGGFTRLVGSKGSRGNRFVRLCPVIGRSWRRVSSGMGG